MTYTEKDKKYKRYTVTSALPYANGPVHIGHLAGVYVPADVYVRYLRSKIDDPFRIRLIETVRGVGYVIRDPA